MVTSTSGAAVLATLTLTTGCSSGGDSESSSGPSGGPGEETTTETTRSVEDEIAARYVGFWDARFDANSPPNPNDPALAEYATGGQLLQVVSETQSRLDRGLAFREAEEPADFQEVDVVEVTADRAVVEECVVSDGVVYNLSTGEIVDDRVTTYRVQGEMQLVDGEWRLARATEIQSWDGVAGCAADR